MAGKEGDESIDELRSELDEQEERGSYPLPEKRDKKQITYKDVDVTITFKKKSEKDSETDERRVLFADSGFELKETLYDEASKVLRVPIVLAKEMVYEYDDYSAFRPKEELEPIAAYLKGVPITRGHPEAKIVTDRAEVEGWVVESEFENDELRAVLEITSKELIADIQSGKLKGVSPGHFSRLDRSASGEYEGKHYDLTQRDIYVDHVAIVQEGRCSVADGCHVEFDAGPGVDNTGKKQEEDERGIMVSKTILNKLDSALKLAEKLEDKALKEKLEAIKKTLEEEAQESERKKEGDAKDEERTKQLDEAMKKVTTERDALKGELETIIEAEKKKVIDELGALQEVKTEEQLKEMSLDSLKGDLELVRSLRGDKVTFDDESKEGDGAIKSAYRGVGRKGGRE